MVELLHYIIDVLVVFIKKHHITKIPKIILLNKDSFLSKIPLAQIEINEMNENN